MYMSKSHLCSRYWCTYTTSTIFDLYTHCGRVLCRQFLTRCWDNPRLIGWLNPIEYLAGGEGIEPPKNQLQRLMHHHSATSPNSVSWWEGEVTILSLSDEFYRLDAETICFTFPLFLVLAIGFEPILHGPQPCVLTANTTPVQCVWHYSMSSVSIVVIFTRYRLFMVGPPGLEPGTLVLWALCANQLRHRPGIFGSDGRDRTYDTVINSHLLCLWATPEQCVVGSTFGHQGDLTEVFYRCLQYRYYLAPCWVFHKMDRLFLNK
jgi:hypothetical protein